MKKQDIELILPKGFSALEERYELSNDQNLQFHENVLSPSGAVISVFEAKEDMQTYDKMIRDYANVTENLQMKKKFSIKIGEKQCYIYIIGKADFLAQGFIQVRGKLFSFVTSLQNLGKNYAETKAANPSFADLVELMRTVK